jgi:D-sedoheptulose 7-phosphate isomerase
MNRVQHHVATLDPIIHYLAQSHDVTQAAIEDPALLRAIQNVAHATSNALRAARKLLLCGNGGSGGDAQHLAGGKLSRLYYDRAPCAAIALTTDTSVLTSSGNDYGYLRGRVYRKIRRGDGPLCEVCAHAPWDFTPLIQQAHMTAGHIICRLVEERLFCRTARTE